MAIVASALCIPAFAAGPAAAVSPGTNGKIVFVSDHERPDVDLYTMDADGENVTRITNDTPDPQFGLQYDGPAWSPDGSRIAAFRVIGVSHDLVTMNGDGSSVTAVLQNVEAFSPSWTPDGLTLAYADNIVGTTSPAHIWKVGVNGSGQTQLTTGITDDGDPAVSPGGTKIAFSHNGEIGTIDLNGAGYVSLTPGVTNATSPSWSPDGTKIAFARSSQGIWTVNANGTGLARVGGNTSYLADARQPAWSPDGTRIAVTRTGGFGGIDTTALDGTCGASLFAPLPYGPQQPDWQPVATPATFHIPTPTGCVRIKKGVAISTTVSIVRSGGFTGPVTLSAGNLPPGTTASFSPNPATGSTSTLTLHTTACPNPTPSGDYSMRITGANGATTRSGYLDLVVDTGPPRVVTGPSSLLVAGKSVATSSVPVRTVWLGCDASNPISYEAQQWKSSVWTAAATGSATSTSPALAFNTKYRYRVRVRAVDTFSAYAYGPYFEPLLTQQTSTSIKYGGTWTTASSSALLGGSSRYSTRAGSSASYTFTGASIAWVGAVSSGRGSANVYIDGVFKATVSTYASTAAYRRVLYAFAWSTQGTHTIKIVVVGTAVHPRIDLDAFVRLYFP
ncbi:MAG TPA: hypothetical protein VGM49_01950 [Candidatus Limnocylindrales bacterium]